MKKIPQAVKLSRIHLDPLNPRHAELQDELSILHHLVKKEAIKPLAKHIATQGVLSPMELLALIRHPSNGKAFVVVEGNRRIASLKLLAEPEKAPSEEDKQFFRKLHSDMGSQISDVMAIVFDSRDQARDWFALRHEGEQGGIGTRPWNTSQITRFNRQTDKRNPNEQSLQLIEYATEHALLPNNQPSAISLTTLTRFLTTPAVRHAIGLVNGSDLTINVSQEAFERASRKLLDDAATGNNGFTSRSNAKQRQEYAAEMQRSGIAAIADGRTNYNPALPASTPQQLPASPPSLEPAPKAEPTIKPTSVRNNTSPDKRNTVVPSSFKVRIQDKMLKRLFDELRQLDAFTFTFSAQFLMRAVLERAATTYLGKHDVENKLPHALHFKLNRLAQVLQQQGAMSKDSLKYLRILGGEDGADNPASADSMGHYLHGHSAPQVTDVIRQWDSIEPVLRHVLPAV